MKDAKNVRSLERGIRILQCFQNNLSLSLTEIAELTSLSASTVSRLLNTLMGMEFIDKNYQKKYILGSKYYDFVDALGNRNNIVEIVNVSLKRLQEKFNETSSFYIEQNKDRICISKIESTHSLRRTVKVGEIRPLTSGAVGEVFLAYMDKRNREQLLDKEKLMPDDFYNNVKENGYSENDGLQEEGVFAISAPILRGANDVMGVISVSGPSERIRRQKDEIIISIKEEAKELSHRYFGYNR